jgi:cell division septal protein FtsQ
MKLRRRRSMRPRINWRQDVESKDQLKGHVWTRSERSLRPPDVPWPLRAVAVLAAVVECAALGWLWFGPALAVQDVTVVGAQHMTSAQVLAAAGLTEGPSVLSVDVQSDRKRLLNQTWVRTASVQPQLTGTIVVQISEWQPIAAYHAGKSAKVLLLSNQAVVLGPAASAGNLVDVQGPSGQDPKVGDRPLDPALLTALVNIQRGFPTFLGQEVAGFIFDSCGELTLVSKRGWKAYFGRVLTPEEFATLRDKLAALKAIAGNTNGAVDYNSPDLDYVNVMNPAEPAVGFRFAAPASPSPAPAGAQPTPSPAPACK